MEEEEEELKPVSTRLELVSSFLGQALALDSLSAAGQTPVRGPGSL